MIKLATWIVAGFYLHASAAAQSIVEEAKLLATDGSAGDHLGFACALSGTTAVVGAYTDSVGGAGNAGSAYVFVRSGATWVQQQRLVASDAAAGDQFGVSVAIDGDTLVVGARGDNLPGHADAGSAYVFVRSGTTWTEQAKLTALDFGTGDEFGTSTSLSGDTALVGATFDGHAGGASAGSAYVFVRSGTSWAQQAKLVASDAAAFEGFGDAVCVSGDEAVVGCPGDAHAGGLQAGSAYVFARSGTTWSEQAKLIAADAQPDEGFGIAVALEGDTALVGAVYGKVAGIQTGSAYVFVQSGASWTQQAKLTASDAAAFDMFGAKVALAGERALIGALFDAHAAGMQAGSAYLFTRSGTSWSEQTKLLASDGAASDWFGASVALSGNRALVGASSDATVGGIGAGSAYVFGLSSCSTAVAATEIVRVGSPPNPAALLPGQTSGPALGATWDPRIDHAAFMSSALVDVLALAVAPTNLPSGLGTILCDISTPPFLITRPPGVAFAVAIPFDCSLAGSTACAQGASTDGASIGLTNALDVTIGTY